MKTRLILLIGLMAAFFAGAVENETPARLDVTAEPEGVKVFVDGKLQGPAPCSVFGLAPGLHLLHLEAPSCVSKDAFVEIKPSAFVQKNFQLAQEKGIILVKTTPAGADVKCNGVSLGTTPLLITSLASSRSHALELSLNGYQKKKIDVKTEGRRPLVREEVLALDSGIVECSSEPAGATVLVNGVEKGVTPMTLEKVPKGLATVVFRLAGYEEETRELRLQPGERQTLALRLKGKAARLTVVSTPEQARVFIDDDFQGKTPLTLTTVRPGEHNIRVELDGHAPLVRTVQVENAGETTEEFTLESTLGRLEVITTPPGARITLDGRSVGTTESQGGDAMKSKLLAVEKVGVGPHTVVVHCNGYQDRAFKINVKSRDTTQLYARMTRIFKPDTLVDTTRGIMKGVLVNKDLLGNITLETAPGVQQLIQSSDIRKVAPIEK